jgi:hypothetical protein
MKRAKDSAVLQGASSQPIATVGTLIIDAVELAI